MFLVPSPTSNLKNCLASFLYLSKFLQLQVFCCGILTFQKYFTLQKNRMDQCNPKRTNFSQKVPNVFHNSNPTSKRPFKVGTHMLFLKFFFFFFFEKLMDAQVLVYEVFLEIFYRKKKNIIDFFNSFLDFS